MNTITVLAIWFAATTGGIGIKLLMDSKSNTVEIQNCRKQLKRFKQYNSSLNDTNRRG